MDFSMVIASFLFSLPLIGKKIEKKYYSLIESEKKRMMDLTTELIKNAQNIKNTADTVNQYAETSKKGTWN